MDGQHKPTRTAPSGFGFDEAERPVPIVWPADFEAATPELALIRDLREIGVTIPDETAAARCISNAFDLHGDERAAQTIAKIISRLPGGRRGTELRLALLSACGISTADEARRLNIPRQILHRSIQRLGQKIFKNG